ncbi:Pr6Pr family membrane protein [Actinocorallia longicatena]|uniref:FAR-17a/AIG1-like protein n=1 Tax=Actinocorallia longicatena TaxID=111803 RepID=A0ABP6QAI4_9ACTN
MRSRGIAGGWWALVAVMVVLGETASLAAHGAKDQLVYFTHQSNIYLGIVAAITARGLWSGRRTPGPPVLTSAILFITITGLIYNVVLASTAAPVHGLAAFSTFTLHKATPVLGVAGWLVFAPHGGLRWIHALWWLAYPLAYFAFALIRGLFVTSGGLRYPYAFLDVVKHGYAGGLTNAAVYATVFLVLGLLLVAVDTLLARGGSKSLAEGTAGQ